MTNKNKLLIIFNLSIFLIVIFLVFYFSWQYRTQKIEKTGNSLPSEIPIKEVGKTYPPLPKIKDTNELDSFSEDIEISSETKEMLLNLFKNSNFQGNNKVSDFPKPIPINLYKSNK